MNIIFCFLAGKLTSRQGGSNYAYCRTIGDLESCFFWFAGFVVDARTLYSYARTSVD